METIIQTKLLHKIYQSGASSVHAVRGVDLTICQGESVAIMGKSGSGKSTLLHMLGGLETPSQGEVYLKGTSVYSLSKKQLCALRRREIGFVFQFFNLIPELSVEENILFPTLLDKRTPDQEYLNRLLSLLKIEEKRRELPLKLSGGQQQRVAIARGLMSRPAILLADEPTGNLDEQSGDQVIELFQQCQRELGQTVVVVTHDSELARRMNRVVVLKDGVIHSDTKEVR